MTTIKSVCLAYIETLQRLRDARGGKLLAGDASPPHDGTGEARARELAGVLGLFKAGGMLLDEVDLILHPLKSELNFPIGDKLDLDFSPLRWDFAIHLLDALFYGARAPNASPAECAPPTPRAGGAPPTPRAGGALTGRCAARADRYVN